MPRKPEEILAMSDEKLMEYTLSGEESSHGLGQAAMNMRVALRMLEANREMVKQTSQWLEANIRLDATTKELADRTESLVRATKGVVWATCGVVAITVITQAALIYFTVVHVGR
jgi:hypothetical protein